MIGTLSQPEFRLIRLVIDVVAQHHRLEPDALLLPARAANGHNLRLRSNTRRQARRHAMYVAYTAFSIRAEKIAVIFGLSGSSVRHTISRVSLRRDTSANEAAALAAIERALGIEVIE